MGTLYIGSCSWKYPSWEGLVYSKDKHINYLQEYAKKYNTVEVDQWFWSLFGSKVRLPQEKDVMEYGRSVPPEFRFTIKLPNALSLTHPYAKKGESVLTPNHHFLSAELLEAFLRSVEPLIPVTGMFMLQFEYLNKKKMANYTAFMGELERFIDAWPRQLPLGIELRNPNWLTPNWFAWCKAHGISAVLLEGYFMPPILELLRANREELHSTTVIRLHGRDRQKMETLTGKQWGSVVRPMDPLLKSLIPAFAWLAGQDADTYINVNNHFEGSAPITIDKITTMLSVHGAAER